MTRNTGQLTTRQAILESSALEGACASPPAGLNHLLVGDPAGSFAPDAVPFSDIRVQFGATAVASRRSRSNRKRSGVHAARKALATSWVSS